MRVIFALLGLMCFVADLRVGDRLANAIVFGGDTDSLWALFAVFMAGMIGSVIGVFYYKK
jgi:ABC-type dipeptide/oligopeptide/nickel transport system permease subunit